ncbi:MauE/DoxX family redox-associated membrane protein [Pedobacter frigoris]|uniref:MauE/DoxX family redox-associated membrane protein n=1 Tax=Pedobacter frigoris TaxID=2571272 RepID=UPI0029308ABB|nr:MauE/DoxX family redox-associated membrane protein [Pedobacter frigoris]
MRKETFIDIIAYALVLLFLYTALSKLFTYSFYLHDLQRSPWLGSLALPISIIIPGAEILSSVLLLMPAKRKIGLMFSLILMTIFTIYVAVVLGFSEELPCTCGGIIRELSWPQHLIFNIFFTALATIGWVMSRRSGTPENFSTVRPR